MKWITILALLTLVSATATAQQTLSYGWEDGYSTVFGTYGNVGGTANVIDVVHSGTNALYGYEDPVGDTPQMYVAWIDGLQDGDEVTASFWAYDITPGASPSARIWAHYTDEHYLDYTGSAGGNGAYSAGIGWEELGWTWTYDGTDPTHEGLMIEFRMYSSAGAVDYWCDDVTVTAPDHARIWFPNQNPVANATESWGGVKALFR